MTASTGPTAVLRPDWTDELLTRMRDCGDDEADAVADELLDRGGPALVNRAWRLMLSRSEILRDPELAECPRLQAYLGTAPFLPDGVDRGRLLRGQQFFATWGPLIALALLTCSLPNSYAAANGVRVIAMTGRLETDPKRRIWETAQILVDALEPHGLDPERAEARGFRTVRDVRLMHAYIRRLLETGYWASHGHNVSGARRVRRPRYRPSQGRWQAECWGKPINQEDLAGTLMSFAYLPVQSLRKGPDRSWLDQQAVEDFIYAWTVVGRLLGVNERLLPNSEAEARELSLLIAGRQHEPSPEGRSVTRALVQELERRVPGRLFDPFVEATIVDQVGAETARDLGLSTQRWRLRLLRGFRWVLVRLHLQQAVFDSFNDEWGYDVVGWMLGGKSRYHGSSFTLPESLTGAWGIEVRPPRSWRTRRPFSARCPLAGDIEERARRCGAALGEAAPAGPQAIPS